MKQKKAGVPCGSNSQKREGCEEQKVTVTTVLHGGVSGWLSTQSSSLCLVPSPLLGFNFGEIIISLFLASLYRGKRLPQVQGKAVCLSCAYIFQPIDLASFAVSTLLKEESSCLQSIRVFLDTPIPLLCRNIRQKHLLGWTCQIPPCEGGNEARLFPAPFLYGMVWATAQMAFPERELFAASGTASLLAPGQSAPPTAHTTAPNAN